MVVQSKAALQPRARGCTARDIRKQSSKKGARLHAEDLALLLVGDELRGEYLHAQRERHAFTPQSATTQVQLRAGESAARQREQTIYHSTAVLSQILRNRHGSGSKVNKSRIAVSEFGIRMVGRTRMTMSALAFCGSM